MNIHLSRAEAMREASLAVMQQSAKPEPGQPYSYSRPMFWAPFVVVGDDRVRRPFCKGM